MNGASPASTIEVDLGPIVEEVHIEECIEGLPFLTELGGFLWTIDGSCFVTAHGRVAVLPELYWSSPATQMLLGGGKR